MTTYKEAKLLAQSLYGPDAAIQEVGVPNGSTCSVFVNDHRPTPVWTGKSWDDFKRAAGLEVPAAMNV